MEVIINNQIVEIPNDEKTSYNLLKRLSKDANVSFRDLTAQWSEKYGKYQSPQNLTNKLGSNSLRLFELLQIADTLNYRVCFELKSTEDGNRSFEELAAEGFIECQSLHYPRVLIAGNNCKIAKNWIEQMLIDYPTMSISEETFLYVQANKGWGVRCMPISMRNLKVEDFDL